MPIEEARVDVEARALGDALEEGDRLVELVRLVLEPAHQIEELHVEVTRLGRVELLEVMDAVAADALDHARRLGQLVRELREPLQRLIEVPMARSSLRDLVEDRERRLVVAHLVEALPEEELRALLVARAIAGLAIEHTLELHRSRGIRLRLIQAQRIREHFGGLGFFRNRGSRFCSGLLGFERHVLRGRVRRDEQSAHHEKARAQQRITHHPSYSSSGPCLRNLEMKSKTYRPTIWG
jgi:hypothetical protein